MARRDVFVEVPAEGYEEGMCGKLEKAMCGTRDSAQFGEFALCFVQGRGNPCMFRHVERDRRLVLHGDDFTIAGYSFGLDCFRWKIIEKM